MALLVDYSMVLEQMRRQELICFYFNSGAFGFSEKAPSYVTGWMGPPDTTIRETVRGNVQSIKPPYEKNLTNLFVRTWQDILRGRLWVMPKSHWAYELDFGNRDWLPGLLTDIGVDPAALQSRTDASAIEFSENEGDAVAKVVQTLLERLHGSDFTIAFPNRNVLCSLHHHKQLWWMTNDQQTAESLRKVPILAPR